MEHLRMHALHYRKCPVLHRIDRDAERAFAKRGVHNFNDCVCHRAGIRITTKGSSSSDPTPALCGGHAR
jgi:hypothetical protein